MPRTQVYLVGEDIETVEKAKAALAPLGVSVQTYGSNQWREGLEDQFFRTQILNHSTGEFFTHIDHADSADEFVVANDLEGHPDFHALLLTEVCDDERQFIAHADHHRVGQSRGNRGAFNGIRRSDSERLVGVADFGFEGQSSFSVVRCRGLGVSLQ